MSGFPAKAILWLRLPSSIRAMLLEPGSHFEAQLVTGLVEEAPGFFQAFAGVFDGLDSGVAISHFAILIKAVVGCQDVCSSVVGGLGLDDASLVGLHGCLQGAGIQAFFVGFADQLLHPSNQLICMVQAFLLAFQP